MSKKSELDINAIKEEIRRDVEAAVRKELGQRNDPLADAKDTERAKRAEIEEFLKSCRPDSEFYIVGNLGRFNHTIQIAADKPLPDPLTGGFRRTNYVNASFESPSHNVGSDLGGYKSGRFWGVMIMTLDLAKHPLISISPEEIKKFHLPKDTPVRPPVDSCPTLSQAIARIHQEPDFLGEFQDDRAVYNRIMTGEQFRLWVKGEYEKRWRDREETSVRLETLRKANPAQVATGNFGAFTSAPEPGASGEFTDPALAAGDIPAGV